MCIAEDVVRIREVLKANAIDKTVDEEVLISLLELYKFDNQRVDLVILELEGMLGKELSVGAQKQRWIELQQSLVTTNEVSIEYENIEQAFKNSIETLFDSRVPSVSQSSSADLNAPSTSRRGVARNALVNQHQAIPKRKTPTKVPETVRPVLPNPQGARTNLLAAKNEAASNSTRQVSTNTTTRVTLQPTRSKVAASQTSIARASVATLPSTTASIGPTSSQENSQQSLILMTEKLEKSAADSAENSEESKEKMKALSISFHKSILDAIPNVNIKFAAFKATEFSKTCGAIALWKEFLGRTLTDPSQKIPRMGTPWNLPEAIDPEHERLCQVVYDHYLSDQVEFLVRTLPDADPSFLEEEVKRSEGDQERIRNFVTEILEGTKTCPTRAEYNKKREYNELANKFFTVEEFLELYDDPIRHFRDDQRITDQAYRDEALTQLKVDFRLVTIVNIKKVFAMKSYHYTPTYMMLLTDQFKQMKVKRQVNEAVKIKTKDLFLIQEVAFVRLLPQIQMYLVNKVKMREEALAISRSNGTLLDCPICCEDELIGLDFTYCPMGHGTCKNCVRRQTEELIGLMKNHVPCLYPDCPSEYSVDALKEVLNKSIFNRFEKRRQAEEILAAGIEGLESCPFCDYCEVPRENDSQFECKNPECLKISCRQCREVNHLPLRCQEFAISQRLHNYMEDEMTNALVRTCPTCKKSFVKSDGCNKMICVCGTMICYICRSKIKNYDHFNNNHATIPNQTGKCPLYSDTNKMHEEEVAKSAERVRAELAQSNPNIRVDLVLGKKL